MKDHNMFHHWIFPEARCNYGTRYNTHSPRNSSECMSLDCNLFKDWNNRVDRYLFLISYLADNNSKKFSLSIPKCLSSTMVRVWEGIPAINELFKILSKLHGKTFL